MKEQKIAELLTYFDPVPIENFNRKDFLNEKKLFGNSLLTNFKHSGLELNKPFELALIFVPPQIQVENRPSSSQLIREQLYHLTKVSPVIRICDPGDLKTGKSLKDALYILDEVCTILFQLKVNVLIVSENQEMTTGNFNALKNYENNINLVHISSQIDLDFDEQSGMNGYLGSLIEKEAPFLYNISCLAFQAYYTHQKQLSKLSEYSFENYRLGLLRNNIEKFEPVLRDADMLSFNLSAIRASDAPEQINPSPNGLFAEEACQLTRYAGMSDRCGSFGIYGTGEIQQDTGQTVRLAAQMLWYYIDGYLNRKHDYPAVGINDYTKYIVEIDEIDIPIVFYKSEKSNRWWIEVVSRKEENNEHVGVIVSCTEEDYIQACNNEIPERWWINFKKLR
ncbi:MAG: hypothetical protein JW798_17795 [Prolixibacteraceae bacterium]|nr:hypothetical protein [Prolixibacteraceae bacterium]